MNSLLIAYAQCGYQLFPGTRVYLRMLSEFYPDTCDRIIEGYQTAYGIILICKALGLPISKYVHTRKSHDEKAIAHLRQIGVIN
jgi:hypothetical protein